MSWAGLRYVPGQEVVLKGNLGSGRIMGSLYAGGTGPRYRIERPGSFTIEVSESTIASAGPVPDYEIGQRVRVRWYGEGTILGKTLRRDAPGHLFTVEIPNLSRIKLDGPKTTTVGAEHIMGTV